MFSLLFGGGDKAADSCCGNREKVSIKNAIPLTPPAPSTAVGDGASAPMSPSGTPAPTAEEIQAAAGQALESTVRFTNEAGDSMKASLSGGGLSDISHALEDVMSEQKQTATSTFEGTQEDQDERPVVTDDGASRKQVLQSFEDRTHAEAEEAADIRAQVDSDTDSDVERLQTAARVLRDSQKKLMSSVKGGRSSGNQSEHEKIVQDATRGEMDDLRMIMDPATAVSRGASRGSAMGRTSTNATNGTSITGDTLRRGLSGSQTAGPSQSLGGMTESLPKDGLGRSQSGLGGPEATMSGMEPAAAEEEEEDDELAGGDDEHTINKKYHGRYTNGMAAKAAEIREKLTLQGLEEPVDMARVNPGAATKKVKSRPLEVLFLDPDDVDEPTKLITFRRKPIPGLRWEKRAPLKINQVKEHSHAEELGVEVGWVVRDIDGINYTGQKYAVIHEKFMKALNFLPDQDPHEAQVSKEAASTEGQCLTLRVRITVEAARGFQNDAADHFCVCLIPGKPHSKVQTSSQCVNDTPDTPELTWGETFELFDFQSGDSIEMAVFAQERAASVNGEDTSLGRVRLKWEQFASKGYHGELALISWTTKQATKTKMKVKVEVDMVPEREQAITEYLRIMRTKMLALGVPEKDVNATFPENVGAGSLKSASDAVRDALRSYHKHSEALGMFMPFPGDGKNDGFSEPEPGDTRKLLEYNKRLDETDPQRLWGNNLDEDENKKTLGWCEDSYPVSQAANEPTASKKSSMFAKISGGLRFGGGNNKTGKTQAQISTIPEDNVKIVFVDEKKEEQTFEFDHAPLGIEWSKRTPLKIASFQPNSFAEEHGAKIGWKIKSVSGDDITKMWYKSASKVLYGHLGRLPTREPSPT